MEEYIDSQEHWEDSVNADYDKRNERTKEQADNRVEEYLYPETKPVIMKTYEELKAEASKIGVLDKHIGPNVWHESPGDQEAFDRAMAEEMVKKIKALTEALTQLVHLHGCEQEGLSSGKPTPEQWFNAVNKAHDVLWPKTEDKLDASIPRPDKYNPPYIEGKTDLQNEG